MDLIIAEKMVDFFREDYTRKPGFFETSAIIGYYRCGATIKEISEIIHVAPVIVCIVIDEYF